MPNQARIAFNCQVFSDEQAERDTIQSQRDFLRRHPDLYYLQVVGQYLDDGITGSVSAMADIGLLSGLYTLGVLIPGIAVSVRRLHDTDRTGWWLLMYLIPVIGALVFLVFMVQDSKPGENHYGPNPKAAIA